MPRLSIETRFDPCEINGRPIEGLPTSDDQILVRAHHIHNEFVIIEFHGESCTVLAADLLKAIKNAMNHD